MLRQNYNYMMYGELTDIKLFSFRGIMVKSNKYTIGDNSFPPFHLIKA